MNNDTLYVSTISEAISSYLQVHGNLFFMQVGGFDGVSFDPLRPLITEGKMSGIIVEPIPDYFAKLQLLYKDSDKVRTCNCAITEEDGERTMWRFKPSAIEQGILSPVFSGISSLVMEDLLKETGTLGALYNDQIRATLHDLLESMQVPCRTFASVFKEYDVTRVDLLQIDTEGYDFVLLKCFDLAGLRPAIVHYESQHLSAADRQEAEDMLTNLGYRITSNAYDTLAVRGDYLEPRA